MKSLAILFSFILIGCSSTPKGEYSRSKIDRPYSLPDDVARSSFGLYAESIEVTKSDSLTEDEDDDDAYGSYLLSFETGIGEDASWIFPLGLRYTAYNDEKHTVGLTAYTLIVFNYASLDYWYRINDKVSLRPYYRNTNLNFLIVEDDRKFFGTEILFQTTQNLALGLDLSKGSFTTKSDFLDDLFDTKNNETSGDFFRLGLNGLYSLSEKWDIEWSIYTQNQEADNDTEIKSGGTEFLFNYFY